MTDTTRSDVDNLYGDRQLTDSEADALVDIANRLADNAYSGQIRTLGEVEGSVKDFKTFIAAHIWELAEGGEVQSASQTNGNVTYNNISGDVTDSLGETRFGRMAQAFIRNGASIGVEKT